MSDVEPLYTAEQLKVPEGFAVSLLTAARPCLRALTFPPFRHPSVGSVLRAPVAHCLLRGGSARSRRFSGGLPAACCSATSTPRAVARCLLRRRRGAFAVFSGDLPAACCIAASTPARPRPLTHTPRAPAPLLRLQDILKEFSKEVIRVQPADILAWSAKCVGAPQRYARGPKCGPTLTPLSPAFSSPPATLRKRRQKLRPRVAAAAAGGEKCAALLIKQLRFSLC